MSSESGFQKKAVATKTSLGGQLKAARIKKNISLNTAEHATRIRLHYLDAIEGDRFDELPASHWKGFVRRYSHYLELPKETIERDLELVPQSSDRKQPFTPWTLKKESRLLITPRGIAVVCSIVVLLGFIGYVTYQVRQFAAPPKLAVTKPVEEAVVTVESFQIEGATDPGASVTIDSLQATVDSEGKFAYQLTLRPGLNQIVVQSENRIKKQTRKIVSVLYQAPEVATESPSPQPSVSP